MIRAILFDMGGTLDGEGHWLDRFVALYKKCGLDLPRESIRQAFDEAERRAAIDDEIAVSNLKQMVELHVGWQLAHLGLKERENKQCLVENFVGAVHAGTATNKQILANLDELGFRLGVVSNGCGNTVKLCKDFGYASHLSVIVDSRCVGLFKPDPAIFLHAANQLGCDPETILMVGDSFDRDIRPAKFIGMKTAWLEGTTIRDCPEPALVDIRLRRLAELPAALSARSLASA
jgi:putative hydrolase of the HAD superfamily